MPTVAPAAKVPLLDDALSHPPGGSNKPTVKTTSLPAETAKVVPPTEPPKVAEVANETVQPSALEKASPSVASIPQATVSEKKNLVVPPVNLETSVANPTEDGVAIEVKTEHETLKDEIQIHAQSLDYTVRREKTIPQHGRPDLALIRGKHIIACEISVTTHKTIEADHIRLRLEAGFTHVAIIAQDGRKLPKIKAAYLKLIPGASLDKVGFYSRNEILSELSAWALDDPEGGVVERAKPKKQNLGSLPPPKDPVEQAKMKRAMLADLRKQMARDREK